MKIILFAGGTGKRFWPVSRKKSPKQFLPIVNDKPLLRLRFEILNQGFDSSDIFISTGKQYEKEVKDILPELPEENFILEPEMRDTGPAVSLAVAYVNKRFPDEVISVQWTDHLIKKPEIFIHALKESEKSIHEDNKVALITVPARFPTPHLGYIKFGEKMKDLIPEEIAEYYFEKFVEKPTKEVAQEYLNDGHYGWNPGYWNFRGEIFFNKLKEARTDFYEIIKDISDKNFTFESLERFKELEKISADYIFAENLTPADAFVLMVDMGWSDVGEWIAFKEALQESQAANLVKGSSFDIGSLDTLVYNTEDQKLIATIGLNGMVVVNTPDVLAVFHKDDSTKLKEFLKAMEEKGLENFL